MKKYETTIIIDPALDQGKIDAIIKKYEEMITKDGEIVELQKWGKKRLAYAINKKPTGYYVHYIYKAAAYIPETIEKDININASVMRQLTIAIEKRQEKEEARLKTVESKKAEEKAKEAK